jgi:hypothetical protein
MICTSSPFREYGNYTYADSPALESTYTYHLTQGHIFTSFEDGEVELAYLAFPVDDKGNPEVPDNQAYIAAVCAYIAYKIAMRLYLQDMINPQKLALLEKEWLFYVNSGYTSMEMPTIDEVESLKNQWVTLLPSYNLHDTAFRNLGNKRRMNIVNDVRKDGTY